MKYANSIIGEDVLVFDEELFLCWGPIKSTDSTEQFESTSLWEKAINIKCYE